ncbi:MAG: hypothetical protein WA152_00435 [Microgenomates group bacterium]
MEPVTQENIFLQQAQPTSIEQPKQNNFLVILLSVLLSLSVSIAGFFAYQTQTLVKELTLLKSSPTLVSSTESTIDPTSDWKTFIHPTYKYQFKYPADWMAKVNSNAQAESLFGPNATQNSGIGGVEVRELDIEPKDFYKLTESKVISSNLLKVNDINGYRYEYQNIMKSNGFVFKHSDGLIYNVYINTEDEEQLNMFDQILSTFKFTESDPTADWKTYRNTSSNYSIKYPSDWKIDNQSAGSMGTVVPDARYIQIGYGEAVSGVLGIEEWQMIPPSEEASLNSTKVIGSLTLRCNGKFTTDTKTWCWIKVPNMNKYINIQVFKNTNEEMNSALDQILSTFKFTI